ncbi:unnamed protein product [Microthlaspi erraticum]|uniref:DUF4283 domain-containing protein n=1 Tax=Microthlaspi erraticum TaxID=1685480 RepID=A0A6D2IW73_9BRAS|nr:unnamed protein product [Microthlaspi erraticum]
MGKGSKSTIHNLSSNAFLFHIPSGSLRKKVLQHELWRVGDSPFFVTEWKASFSLDPPSLQKAPIRVTIKNIPFDLVTDIGMGFIAKPLGKVVDAKPFTSVNSAEIKVVVNFTKTLPTTMEIERETTVRSFFCPSIIRGSLRYARYVTKLVIKLCYAQW